MSARYPHYLDDELEPKATEIQHHEQEGLFLCSIAISLKRIADYTEISTYLASKENP
jgi:hypothetical protein